MDIPFGVLKSHIASALAGTATHRELTELVHFARAIAQSHLECIRASVSYVCETLGLSLEDVAYDCLAEAFRRSGDRRFIYLESFASSLDGGLGAHNDTEVFLAFRSFLARVVDQHLARLYAQADPEAGKIYRNAKAAATKSGLFTLQRDIRGVVLCPTNCPMLDHLPPFPHDELERLLVDGLRSRRRMTDLISTLHSCLQRQQSYRRSVPLYQATAIFKRLVANDLESEQAGDTLDMGPLTEVDLVVVKDEVRAVLRQKMLVTYVMKGKTDQVQTRAILSALDDLLDDWVNAKTTSDGLFRYLQTHLPMDTQEYAREYRSKMEYLLRIAKEEFQARLMDGI